MSVVFPTPGRPVIAIRALIRIMGHSILCLVIDKERIQDVLSGDENAVEEDRDGTRSPPHSAIARRRQRRIGHLDMDAFFAAVEQLDHPTYRGQPVIVGGLGPRGVVATASYEARAYGVGSAMPMSRARRLCPNGIFLRPRFFRYHEISVEVLSVLRTYTPLIQTISLDEAFFDLTESERRLGPADTLAAEIKARVQEATGLTASVGLAPNRFLAKLASELRKPDGFMVIEPDRIHAILDPLPVRMIWGVGKITERRLRSLGLTSVRAIRLAPLELLVREFGGIGRSLQRLAHGIDESPVEPNRDAKSISREVTLPRDLFDPVQIETLLRSLSQDVAGQLRKEELLGRTLRIKIRFPDFQTITRQTSLPVGTDSAHLIQAFALDLFRRRVSLDRRGIRLIGVGVGALSHAHARQLPLFDDESGPERPYPTDGTADTSSREPSG